MEATHHFEAYKCACGVVEPSVYMAQLRDIQLLASALLNHNASPDMRLRVQNSKSCVWVGCQSPHTQETS